MENQSKFNNFSSGIEFVKSIDNPSASVDSPSTFNNTQKSDLLLDAVFAQHGIRGQLIIYDSGTSDNPLVTLQNSLSVLQLHITVEVNPNTLEYEFFIGNELICTSGKKKFFNKQDAKNELAKDALDILKKDCFVLLRNRNHIDITGDNLMKNHGSQVPSDSDFNKPGSTAHNIMLKMGWKGGGLGSMQQGRVDNVQVYENIDRRGLGNKNVLREVTKILREFSNSNKFTILAFDSSFTKSEREAIHKTARRFDLKSKSEGKGDDRRMTVSRKINRSDIVRELLKKGGENKSYKLQIPKNFEHI